MTQPFADALTQVPRSRAFGATLANAHDIARAKGHAIVTLEHLTLALTEDADARPVLEACKLSLGGLSQDIAAHLATLPQSDALEPSADPDLVKILEYAAIAARQSGRREVTGSIALAALTGEGNSTAARLLKARGLTFQDTVRALQAGVQRPQPAATAPPPAQAAVQPPPAPAPAPLAPAGFGAPLAPLQAAPAPPPPMAPPAALEPASPETEDAITTARKRIAAARSGQPLPPLPEPAPRPVPAPPPRHEANGWAPPAATSTSQPRAVRLPPPLPPVPGPPPQMGPQHRATTHDTRMPPPPWSDAAADLPAPPRAPLPQPQPFDAEKLIEFLPERVRAGRATPVEIEITRAEIAGLSGARDGFAFEASSRKAIAVKLKSRSGAILAEPASPETMWLGEGSDSLSDDHLRWRWTLLPRRRGKDHLQLLISVRTIGRDGITTEQSLPVIAADVAIVPDYSAAGRTAAAWLLAAVTGGLLVRLADGPISAGVTALAHLAGL